MSYGQVYLEYGLKFYSIPFAVIEDMHGVNLHLPPDVESLCLNAYGMCTFGFSGWICTNTLFGMHIFVRARYLIAIAKTALADDRLRAVDAVMEVAAEKFPGWRLLIDTLVASVDNYIALSNASVEWADPMLHQYSLDHVIGTEEAERCKDWAEAQSRTVKSLKEMNVVLRVIGSF
jgi:hypothetical protein